MIFNNCNKLTAELKHQTSGEIAREQDCDDKEVILHGKPTSVIGYRGKNTNRATGFEIFNETGSNWTVGVVEGDLIQEQKDLKGNVKIPLKGRIVGIRYDGEDQMDFIQFIVVSEKHF